MHQAILQIPGRVWEPAYDADGQARPGAWVAELTGRHLFTDSSLPSYHPGTAALVIQRSREFLRRLG